MAEGEENPVRKRSAAVDLLAAYTIVLGLIHLAVAAVALYWVVTHIEIGIRELRPRPQTPSPPLGGGEHPICVVLGLIFLAGALIGAILVGIAASVMSISELSTGARLMRRRPDSRIFAMMLGGICLVGSFSFLSALYQQLKQGPYDPTFTWIVLASALIHGVYGALAFPILLNRNVAEEFGVVFPPPPAPPEPPKAEKLHWENVE